MVPIKTWLAGARAQRLDSGRPLVTLSYAQSLDGCIAARRGQPLALSGKDAQVFTHTLRAAHDAILVGIGTVLADNPRLTVRWVEGRDPQPVILDSRLRFPLDANLLREGRSAPWIAILSNANPQKRARLEAAGVRFFEIPAEANGRIHLAALLERLGALSIDSLMVEGGAQVISAFLTADLVDQVAITIAPVFLGGLRAVETQQPLPMLPRLQDVGYERKGDDLVVWGKLTRGAS